MPHFASPSAALGLLLIGTERGRHRVRRTVGPAAARTARAAPAVVRAAAHAHRILARRARRRHLLVRRRAVLRLDRQTSRSTDRSSAWPDRRVPGTGWSRPTAASSRSTAPFYGSTGNICSTGPWSAWPRRPTRHGYWLVASDGGIFGFGNAAVPRIDRRDPPRVTRRRDGPDARAVTATGSSRPTAASSRSATPASTARPAACT